MTQGQARNHTAGVAADGRSFTRQELKASAMELSRYIKLASWLGKTATSQRGRRLAYQVKAASASCGSSNTRPSAR